MNSDKASAGTRVITTRLTGPRHLEFGSVSINFRDLEPDQVAVQAKFSAISPGTELAAWTGLPPLRPGSAYPRLVGYCSCGSVVAIGKDVTTVEVGDSILSFAPHQSGYLLREADVVAKVPGGLSGAEASTAYLFGLGYGALQRAELRAGHLLAVIGLGALGVATIAMAKVAGAQVVAFSSRKSARELAERLGAVALGKDDPAGAEIGADVVVTTSGTWDDWSLALRVTRRRGAIAVLGFPGRGLPVPDFNPLDSQFFYDKQLSIFAAGQMIEGDLPKDVVPFTLRRNMNYVMGLMAQGRLPSDELARYVRPASQLASAYDDLAEQRGSALTFVLQW